MSSAVASIWLRQLGCDKTQSIQRSEALSLDGDKDRSLTPRDNDFAWPHPFAQL